jgi:glycosyltransferase involved in cell wall biosynthesis
MDALPDVHTGVVLAQRHDTPTEAQPNNRNNQPVYLTPAGATLGHADIAIVIPALNEELVIGEFVDWCKEGLAAAGVRGQILIVDSSTDKTPHIALAHGAEVLRTPVRGLGRAYIDALPYIRANWIIMGDADLTYDFREIAPFVERFREGTEFVMGSRFRGSIETGAMPALHRYFGTPLTTWLLNRIYHSSYSDIHCGMRGVTREALDKIDLKSQSWEYASEMVLKAARLRLVTAEVPVKFYKDRPGRVSHHKRLGWLSPWIAGWLNLKVMLVYTPDTFLLKPGAFIMGLGLLLSFALAPGPFQIGRVGFSLYWMLLGVTLTTLGYSCVQIGILSRIMHGLRPGFTSKVRRFLTYNRGLLIAGASSFIGVCLVATLVWRYLQLGLHLQTVSHPAILGLLLIILGFQTFCFTLLLEMAQRVMPASGAK